MSQTIEAEVIRTLRTITRLQTTARRLRRQLKANQTELRQRRRELRALQQVMEQRRPDVVPIHAFGGAIGFARGSGDGGTK